MSPYDNGVGGIMIAETLRKEGEILENRIVYETPDDCMVTVQEESVQNIKEHARSRHLTTNRLSIRTGLDKSIIEGLYYGKHRIKLSHLQVLCDTVFSDVSGDEQQYTLQEHKENEKVKGE